MMTDSALWRRLDVPGHDACRLERNDAGWRLEGTAVFRHERGPARLAYRLMCDPAWRAQEGHVQGWLGAEAVAFRIVRTSAGTWTLNGAVGADLEDGVDLDFGFAPAANLPQLRRLALEVEAGTLALLSRHRQEKVTRRHNFI
jgi:uncharacterized protein